MRGGMVLRKVCCWMISAGAMAAWMVSGVRLWVAAIMVMVAAGPVWRLRGIRFGNSCSVSADTAFVVLRMIGFGMVLAVLTAIRCRTTTVLPMGTVSGQTRFTLTVSAVPDRSGVGCKRARTSDRVASLTSSRSGSLRVVLLPDMSGKVSLGMFPNKHMTTLFIFLD